MFISINDRLIDRLHVVAEPSPAEGASGIELDADGLIRRSYVVLATRKLTAVHFPESVALG